MLTRRFRKAAFVSCWAAASLVVAAMFAAAGRAEDVGRYALLVGVERYNPAFLTPLEYAEDDMEAVGRALEKLGFNVVTMTSAAAIPERRPVSAADIMAQVEKRVRSRAADDIVLLAFSGHGAQLKADAAGPDGERETWFCPERARLDDATTLLPMSQVLDKLRGCAAKQKLLLVDACRVDAEPKGIRDKSGVPTIELDAAAPFRRRMPEGMLAIFSCGPRQKSYELAEINHSVFTHFVIEYLEGRADASRYSRQRPTVQELASYVSRQTRDLVDQRLNGDQEPEMVVPAGRFTDWPLGTLGSLASVDRRPAVPGTPRPLPEVPAVPRPAAVPRAGEVVENSLGMKLVAIAAGEFEMGSEESDYEKPVHRVRITKPFLMGQTEVTQGQFERVMGTTPWRGKDSVKDGPTVAASYVSWDDAVEFCRKLTEIERRAGRLPAGGAYRLPTEAEWEYACRAGTKTKWSFGDDEAQLSEHAWWGGLFGDGNAKTEQYAHEVGRKKANSWGLFDMHGNVWEWCSDSYDEKYYAQSPAADPKGPSSAGSFRVIRGGSWFYYPVACRSASRRFVTPTRRDFNIGFRVVCELE